MEQSLLETPRLVLDLVGQALDNDIFEVTAVATEADIGHRHVRVIQNDSSNQRLAHHIVSAPTSPVVAFVERDADLEAAAKALVAARFGQGGKSPYAPDTVLVNEWIKKEFLSELIKQQIAFTVEDTKAIGSKKAMDLIKDGEREGSSVVSSSPDGSILDIHDRYISRSRL